MSSPSSANINLSQTNKGGELISFDISEQEIYRDIDGIHEIISLTDNNVSDVWNYADKQNVVSYGAFGSISSVHSKEYVYFLITHDISMEWIALQFDSDQTGDPEAEDSGVIPMQLDDDIWLLGDASTTNVLGDAYSAGQATIPYINHDSQDDLLWERVKITGESEYYAWEIKRRLVTNDTEGHDVSFTLGNNVTMMMASDQFHKFDFKITEMKFSLSSQKLDLDFIPITEDSPINIFIDGFSYLTLNLQSGIIIGISFQVLILIILIAKLRRIKS